MSDREIAIEVLEDFLEYQYKRSQNQSEVRSDIHTYQAELIHLDGQNSHDSSLTIKVETKIRDLEQKINKGFFKKLTYPVELYSKDLQTKIAYLNETIQDSCPVCKNGILKLVPSGKVWMCSNRCSGKRWCTTDEIEFIGIDIKRYSN